MTAPGSCRARMGVAIDMAALAAEPVDHQALLSEAGYVLDRDLELWINPTLDRALHAGIAAKLTANQLTAWIAAGR